MPDRHRVVVIGAGFGGLRLVRNLKDAPVDVVVVDRHNFHTFQALLYQVATAGLDVDDIAYPLRGVFRRQSNVISRVASVTDIDLDLRRVVTDRGEPLDYDTLVLAAGTVSHDFGLAGVAEHALPMKTAVDAVAIRNQILARFEQATFADDIGHRLDVIVCGGGPTGLEMAGGLTELYQRVLRKDFPELPVEDSVITLVEALDRVLPGFDDRLRERAAQTLVDRGVDVVTGRRIDHIDEGAVVLEDGRRIEAGTIIWAAGVRASPLTERLGVELGRGGRIVVDRDLTIPGHPDVFAIGDIAIDPVEPLPQMAQPAIQGGKHVARQIRRRIAGQPTERFAYHDKGSMATIGRNQAVAQLPSGVRLSGRIGWLAWLGLHLVYLLGVRNRLNVFVNWAWNYVTYDRASRLLDPTTEVAGHGAVASQDSASTLRR